MKAKLPILALALMAPAAVALAQQNSKDGPPPPPPHFGPPMGMLLVDVIDTDHDGILSATEIPAAPDMLKKLDKNGDGQLTQDEYCPPPPPPPDGQSPGKQQGFQKSGQFPPPPPNASPGPRSKSRSSSSKSSPPDGPPKPPQPQILTALDTDGDGVISAEEISKAAVNLLTLDKNGDGQLGPREYGPPPPPKPPGKEDEGAASSDSTSGSDDGTTSSGSSAAVSP